MNLDPNVDVQKKVISSLSGLNMLCHSCLVSITVITPLGEQLHNSTKYVGADSSNYILLKLPSYDSHTLANYFQVGFDLNVKVVARRGEGVIVCFRTKIKNIILQPIALLVIDIPKTMILYQLRSEPRYDVDISAEIIGKSKRIHVKIIDISISGCCFVADIHASKLEGDELLEIKVMDTNFNNITGLTGKISNFREENKTISYGMMFDSQSKVQIKELLSQLISDDSTKLVNQNTSHTK
ncbi:PilZ domain-containing protein [Photobacterium sp. OFAV2-7]|uniref:PilZ domain-containing protein n=1 Tax=Photobacterium sp. OFAV2-7 TaxID=2917748 RepID=UPI001EF4ACFF|nr:PilZ domain-containing protein [Photobacterium sp. OFAV2-7]MCG7584316.1 flagellar brake protein [Photobacterium sp. OFAV2-7]